MLKNKVLIIDDEPTVSSALSKTLNHHGYLTKNIRSKREFNELKNKEFHDIVLLDLRLPDGSGLDLMKQIKKTSPQTQVIIITGYGTIDLAVTAVKEGAFHFITKPFNIGEIINLCAKALSHTHLEEENKQLKETVKKQYCFKQIIGQSLPMLGLIETIKKISSSSSAVLITGESGTGKELAAKAIHFNSDKTKNGPFIPVHCGAVPKDLLESELFGHLKGSFTGAVKDRMGKFHKAENGTIFLDEISTMDMSAQVKLLRVLQEKEFQPVGSDEIISCHARVIAAANENLEAAVKKGSFRKDLFYRLNVIPLKIPSLRERTKDIPFLISHFIKAFNKENKRSCSISQSAVQKLCRYEWPGNIRELENLIERLCVLKENITVEDLPEIYQNKADLDFSGVELQDIPNEGLDLKNIVNLFENDLILKALKKTNWNRNQAAQLLKLNRTTLLEKIKKKGLKDDMPLILEDFEKSPS